MSGVRVSARSPALPPAREAALRKAVQQLEGVFVEQLYKAMRETVPDGGVVERGAGEDMFSGLMDQHVASETPLEWRHGLGEALYRQLSARMAGTETEPGTSSAAGPAHSGGESP